MFRAALFSIVLTLTVGQNVALLCGVWCHSGEGMVGTCEHKTHTSAAPAIVANDDCTITGNTVALVREDARRVISAPNVEGGALVPRFAFTPPSAGILSTCESVSRLPLEQRPLLLALRI